MPGLAEVLITQRQSEFGSPDLPLVESILRSEAMQQFVKQRKALVERSAHFGQGLHLAEVIEIEPDMPDQDPALIIISGVNHPLINLPKIDRS